MVGMVGRLSPNGQLPYSLKIAFKHFFCPEPPVKSAIAGGSFFYFKVGFFFSFFKSHGFALTNGIPNTSMRPLTGCFGGTKSPAFVSSFLSFFNHFLFTFICFYLRPYLDFAGDFDPTKNENHPT